MTFAKLSTQGAPIWINSDHVFAITQNVGQSGCVLTLANHQDAFAYIDENAWEVAALFNASSSASEDDSLARPTGSEGSGRGANFAH